MLERYKMLQGDCLVKLQELIDNGVKVNSVICDIPYGTTACSWDEVIPFDKMWGLLYKITYDDSPIVLFSSQPFTSKLINSNINNFREEIIWLKNKSASGMQYKQKHLKVHENIIVFAKNGKYTYNPQKWEVKEKASEIVEQIVTKNRVQKELYKMIDEGVLPQKIEPQDMRIVAQNLPKRIFEDCVKEENELVVEAGEFFGKMCGSATMNWAKKIIFGE